MQRVTLLYNPAAGRRSQVRLKIIEQITEALQARGLAVESIETEASGGVGEQAHEACRRGAYMVFACGGDGTVHDVLQGMTFHPETALGVIPLGSANALARHLKLPLDPVEAALEQATRKAKLIPVGRVTYQTSEGERSRYFLVMAGAGADGMLVYKMLADSKHRLGRASYYLRAARLFLRSRFASFTVVCKPASSSTSISLRAVSAMAVRERSGWPVQSLGPWRFFGAL